MPEGLHPVYLTLILCCPSSVVRRAKPSHVVHICHMLCSANINPWQQSQIIGDLARQVFWLPRPFSNLPIPIIRNSGVRG